VDEETVWKDALGGQNSSVAAYFLIYISKSFAEESISLSIDTINQLPPYVTDDIILENNKYKEDIVLYQKKKETDVDHLVEEHVNTMRILNNIQKKTIFCDYRVANIYAYLNGNNDEIYPSLLFYDLWKKHLKIDYKLGFDSPEYREISRKLYNSDGTTDEDRLSKVELLYNRGIELIDEKKDLIDINKKDLYDLRKMYLSLY